MAEPTNTPMPPGTPIHGGTPRSSSPVLPTTFHAPTSVPTTFTVAVQEAPTSSMALASAASTNKLRVLHIGDPTKYHPALYAEFGSLFDVVRPEQPERERQAFVTALKEGRWGNFHAIFRPFWGTGGEMGKWDEELISLLPQTVRVFASAGSGYDWADVRALGRRGEYLLFDLALWLRQVWAANSLATTCDIQVSSTAIRPLLLRHLWPTSRWPLLLAASGFCRGVRRRRRQTPTMSS